MPQTTVQVSGHIIDSLILPKILDTIINLGGEFEIIDIRVGHRRADRSYAKIQVDAPSQALLDELLSRIREHGALPVDEEEEPAELEPAPEDGIFPDRFYATTNLITWVRVKNRWIEVERPEMDCGIRVDLDSMRAECVPIHRIKKGDPNDNGLVSAPQDRIVKMQVAADAQ